MCARCLPGTCKMPVCCDSAEKFTGSLIALGSLGFSIAEVWLPTCSYRLCSSFFFFFVPLPSSRASYKQISVLQSHLDFAASCFHVLLSTAVFSHYSATYCGFVLAFNLPLMAVIEVGTNRYVFASNLRTESDLDKR